MSNNARNQVYSPASRAISSGRSPVRGKAISQASPPVPPPKPVQQTKANEPQPTLRVMRLYKPRFNYSAAVPYSSQLDLLNGGIGTADQSMSKLLLGRRESDFALSSCLILPDSFGDIYRGETFCAYISVLNHLSVELKDVKVTARLVTPSSKKTLPLADCRIERGATTPGPQAADVLPQGNKLDMVIQSLLSETGDYVLKVTVECAPPVYQTYTPPSFQNLPGSHPGQATSTQGGNRPVSHSQGNINPAPPSSGPGRSPSSRSASLPHGMDQNLLKQAQAQYGHTVQQQQAAPPMFTPTPEPVPPKKFTKYYRFSVAAPVEMSSTSRMLGGYALVEVSVRNVTPNTLVISDLALIAMEGLHSQNMSCSTCSNPELSGVGSNAITHLPMKSKTKKGEAIQKESIFSSDFRSSANSLDKHLLLASQDVRQFLFKVWAPPPYMLEANGQALGSLFIQWRTALGESGNLRSPAITSPVATKRDIVVTLSPNNSLKTHFEVGTSFDVTLRVFNHTDRALPLHLRWSMPSASSTSTSSAQSSSSLITSLISSASFSDSSHVSGGRGGESTSLKGGPSAGVFPSSSPGVLVQGASSFNLGTVGSKGGYRDCTVSLVALCPGLHGLFGFVVTDDSSGRQWRIPPLTTLYVQPKDFDHSKIASSLDASLSDSRRISDFQEQFMETKDSAEESMRQAQMKKMQEEEINLISDSTVPSDLSTISQQLVEEGSVMEELVPLSVSSESDKELEVPDLLRQSTGGGIHAPEGSRLSNDGGVSQDTLGDMPQVGPDLLRQSTGGGIHAPEGSRLSNDGALPLSQDVLGDMPPVVPGLFRQSTGGGIHGDGSNDAAADVEGSIAQTGESLALISNDINPDMMESIAFGEDSSAAANFFADNADASSPPPSTLFDSPPPSDSLYASAGEGDEDENENGGGFVPPALDSELPEALENTSRVPPIVPNDELETSGDVAEETIE